MIKATIPNLNDGWICASAVGDRKGRECRMARVPWWDERMVFCRKMRKCVCRNPSGWALGSGMAGGRKSGKTKKTAKKQVDQAKRKRGWI